MLIYFHCKWFFFFFSQNNFFPFKHFSPSFLASIPILFSFLHLSPYALSKRGKILREVSVQFSRKWGAVCPAFVNLTQWVLKSQALTSAIPKQCLLVAYYLFSLDIAVFFPVFITLTVSIHFILTRFLKENTTCLHGSKNPHKMSLERYLMDRSTPFSLTC